MQYITFFAPKLHSDTDYSARRVLLSDHTIITKILLIKLEREISNEAI